MNSSLTLKDKVALATGDGRGVGKAIAKHLATAAPLRRTGQPEEVTGLALCFASGETAFVTGRAFAVDGVSAVT